jgi:hypothetical protein
MVLRPIWSPRPAAGSATASSVPAPVPLSSGRWRNLQSVVASGVPPGATPTNRLIAAEPQTCSSHARPERPKHVCTTYILGIVESSTRGLPMPGLTPRLSASAFLAPATSASHSFQGQASSGSDRKRALRVALGLPACISRSEKEVCRFTPGLPKIGASALQFYHSRRYMAILCLKAGAAGAGR